MTSSFSRSRSTRSTRPASRRSTAASPSSSTVSSCTSSASSSSSGRICWCLVNGGAGGNRTHAWGFCRPLPYCLATAPTLCPSPYPLPRGEGTCTPTTYSLQPPHLLLRPECHPIQDEKYLFLKIALRRERERCGPRVTDLPHHRAQLVKPLRRLFRDWLGGERV